MSFGRFTSQLLRSLPAQAFSVSLAGMALWASCPSPVVAAGAPLEAVVTQVVRRVDWQRALTTRWQPAGLDLVLLTGDSLRTGQDAKAELLYGDGSVTRVGALTRLTIAGDQKRELRLEAGRIWLQIRKSGAGMRIVWPGAVATVTGTELVVEFDPTRRATEVTVFEGAVDVAGDVGQLV
ncbi:MAG: FecR family protein, partial [Candidatus Sericytochromatia bacterium]|nr:FecR family protein [Candidatus Sericytochromatia bacterium]